MLLLKNKIGKRQIILLCLLFQLIPPLIIRAQSYTSYFTGNPLDKVTVPLGGVCLMGGATEHDEAMKWFLQQSTGGDILVLRVSGSNGYNNYMFSQLGITVNSVETIVFNSAVASGEAYIHQKIKQAEAIWFAGGDQWDYISYWRNTFIDSLINDGVLNRNIVIGGTSAGMAIQGGFYFSARKGTITSEEALSNPFNAKMTVDSSSFLKNKYLENVITDTHYNDPDRKGRHVTFLARILSEWGVEAKGIASDAYAAICIDSDGLARCYGDYPKSNDFLYFIQTNCELSLPGPEVCTAQVPLEWNRGGEAIKVYKVSGTNSGQNTFNLNDWNSGSGGSWEHWYISNGVLYESSGDNPDCPLSQFNTNQDPKKLFAYPNPANGSVLEILFPGVDSFRLSVFDTFGNEIDTDVQKSWSNKQINISGFPDGVYIVVAIAEDEVRQVKVVVN